MECGWRRIIVDKPKEDQLQSAAIRVPFSEAVLQENVYSVTNARQEPFVIGAPAQIVKPKLEIPSRRNSVADIEGAVANAPPDRKIRVNRIVRGVARVE